MRAIIIASHLVPRLLDSRHLLAESGRIMLSATQAVGNCRIAWYTGHEELGNVL
jgi:hypothetical protein